METRTAMPTRNNGIARPQFIWLNAAMVACFDGVDKSIRGLVVSRSDQAGNCLTTLQ